MICSNGMSSVQFYTKYASTTATNVTDGVSIRELINPANNGNKNQSLAEATFQPGARYITHFQKKSEKIYHITEGRGVVRVGGDKIDVKKGDSITIPPGTIHNAVNTSDSQMKLLCFMTPPFQQNDITIVHEE